MYVTVKEPRDARWRVFSLRRRVISYLWLLSGRRARAICTSVGLVSCCLLPGRPRATDELLIAGPVSVMDGAVKI
jgi:hypothetical protein